MQAAALFCGLRESCPQCAGLKIAGEVRRERQKSCICIRVSSLFEVEPWGDCWTGGTSLTAITQSSGAPGQRWGTPFLIGNRYFCPLFPLGEVRQFRQQRLPEIATTPSPLSAPPYSSHRTYFRSLSLTHFRHIAPAVWWGPFKCGIREPHSESQICEPWLCGSDFFFSCSNNFLKLTYWHCSMIPMFQTAKVQRRYNKHIKASHLLHFQPHSSHVSNY